MALYNAHISLRYESISLFLKFEIRIAQYDFYIKKNYLEIKFCIF